MDIDMEGVNTRGIRLEPTYQGWGHMWGEGVLGL